MAQMIIKPLVSEKAMGLGEGENTYVFVVPARATKIEVANEISQRFRVKVKSVNTANIKGKAKTALVKRGRQQIPGTRSDFKKAYIKLASGDSIKLFDEPKETKTKKGKK